MKAERKEKITFSSCLLFPDLGGKRNLVHLESIKDTVFCVKKPSTIYTGVFVFLDGISVKFDSITRTI